MQSAFTTIDAFVFLLLLLVCVFFSLKRTQNICVQKIVCFSIRKFLFTIVSLHLFDARSYCSNNHDVTRTSKLFDIFIKANKQKIEWTKDDKYNYVIHSGECNNEAHARHCPVCVYVFVQTTEIEREHCSQINTWNASSMAYIPFS